MNLFVTLTEKLVIYRLIILWPADSDSLTRNVQPASYNRPCVSWLIEKIEKISESISKDNSSLFSI